MHPDLSYMMMQESEEPNPPEDSSDKISKTKKFFSDPINKAVLILTVLLFFVSSFNYFFFDAPSSFLENSRISISSGMTVKDAGKYLKDNSIIKSPFVFRVLVKLYRGNKGIVAGRYVFEKPSDVFQVVNTLTNSGYREKVFKVTIPEGLSNKQIADLLYGSLDNFDKTKFLSIAKDKEGYLFPDTYFFEPETSPEKVIEMMSANFDEKIKSIKKEIDSSKRSLKDILTMASILEEEARLAESRKMVSDILWRRIVKGMPLQVDASFVYLLGKGSAELSLNDLDVESPYNTYKYKGLPPGPIANPGIDAILSAIYPTNNPYWFYLSDKDGNMHYAKTFDEHKENKNRYLR
ncbi:MAG: endolytic transglycosylase MltG [bacterium]